MGLFVFGRLHNTYNADFFGQYEPFLFDIQPPGLYCDYFNLSYGRAVVRHNSFSDFFYFGILWDSETLSPKIVSLLSSFT